MEPTMLLSPAVFPGFPCEVGAKKFGLHSSGSAMLS
ncbi:hypothetical protein SLEP1_g6976 [Rubroshorea leprosula]|uniref:Uncharacterized protein n=1 Tax=Rubroshorea leprosula TaxID=152421 RepID=A0AAV5I6W2_9ROSI|nr:hypothetical protein SLEP1_g6976 [Rubroshorea leprosula]